MDDDDAKPFSEKEKHSLPDRHQTRGGTFATSTPVSFLASDEFVITNPIASAGTHTFTFTPRGSGGSGQTFTEVLEAGRSCRYSGRGIQQVTIDSTDSAVTWKAGPRGTVFAVSNPSSGGGAASAQILPTDQAGVVGATPLMAGLGSAATPSVFTPKGTGILEVTLDGQILGADSGSPASVLVGLQMATGTGAAPANGAAATGTTRGPQVTALGFGGGASTYRWPFSIRRRFTATAGTQIWIDLQIVGGTGTTTTTVSHVTVNVEEVAS